ncbi:MAG: TonB-dependent receptor, partial [Woeseiaceae bacterium]|nr:TonB-dependent receptor [Woeseiaceae bacterium]
MASDSRVADDTSTVAKKSKPIDVITIIGRQADASDVPGSAHVIDTETLAEFSASDILRVLRSVPGVYVQEEEGFGLRPNIGIRGSGLDRSARIALLEDGILIAPAPYAASSAYYFPTQRRMSGIEVLKGPAAVTVGPRTTGGAINLISTPIPATTTAYADVRVAGDNTLDAHLNVGGSGESVGWLLETVQASTDGFKTIDNPAGGRTGYDLNDTILKLRYDTETATGIGHSVSMKLGHAEQDANETYLGLTRDDFDADPYRRYAASANDRFDSTHKQVQLSYAIDADSFWRASASLYRNDFSRNWYKLQSVGGSSLSAVLEDPDTFVAEYDYLTGGNSPDDALQIRANKRDYISEGVQGRVEWDFGIGDASVQLNTGFRLHEDEEDRFQHQDGFRMEEGLLVQTTFAAPGSQTNRVSTADVTAVFVDADIRIGNWILTPGARHENIRLTRFDYATSDPTRTAGPTRVRSNSTSVLIPGFGALYKLNADWRLLAGVHRGYNPPAPGSSAAAEKSINVEAGFRFD